MIKYKSIKLITVAIFLFNLILPLFPGVQIKTLYETGFGIKIGEVGKTESDTC